MGPRAGSLEGQQPGCVLQCLWRLQWPVLSSWGNLRPPASVCGAGRAGGRLLAPCVSFTAPGSAVGQPVTSPRLFTWPPGSTGTREGDPFTPMGTVPASLGASPSLCSPTFYSFSGVPAHQPHLFSIPFHFSRRTRATLSHVTPTWQGLSVPPAEMGVPPV